jgi:hypothetical protein
LSQSWLESGSLVDGIVTRFELDRCQILEALMRPDMVVVPTPGFDYDARLFAAPEPLERQALVPELSVEALIGAVLPRLARVVESGVDLLVGKPLQDPRLTNSEPLSERR